METVSISNSFKKLDSEEEKKEKKGGGGRHKRNEKTQV